MIVVDSSAVIAMMLQEPPAAALAARLAVDSERVLSDRIVFGGRDRTRRPAPTRSLKGN